MTKNLNLKKLKKIKNITWHKKLKWYNKGVDRYNDLKNTSWKKLKISIDKENQLWYNKDVSW